MQGRGFVEERSPGRLEELGGLAADDDDDAHDKDADDHQAGGGVLDCRNPAGLGKREQGQGENCPQEKLDSQEPDGELSGG